MADARLGRLVTSTLAVATTGCVWIVIAVAERPRALAPERALAPLPTVDSSVTRRPPAASGGRGGLVVEPQTRVATSPPRARRPVPLARTRSSR